MPRTACDVRGISHAFKRSFCILPPWTLLAGFALQSVLGRTAAKPRLRADCSGPKQVGFHTRRGARYKACDHLHGDPDAAGEPIARPISGERRSGFSLWPSGSLPGNHAVSAVQRQKARWERGTPVREMQRRRLRGAGKTDERQPEQRQKRVGRTGRSGKIRRGRVCMPRSTGRHLPIACHSSSNIAIRISSA